MRAQGSSQKQIYVSNLPLKVLKTLIRALGRNAAQIQTISPGQGFGVLIVEINFIITVL
jgi:hypothetical protein